MIRLGLTSFSEHDYLTGKKRATVCWMSPKR